MAYDAAARERVESHAASLRWALGQTLNGRGKPRPADPEQARGWDSAQQYREFLDRCAAKRTAQGRRS